MKVPLAEGVLRLDIGTRGTAADLAAGAALWGTPGGAAKVAQN